MRTFASLLLFIALLAGHASAGDRSVLFRENFRDLRNWRDLFFPKISSHSTYTVDRCEGSTCLKTESHASASALVQETAFSVHEYPRARWRWKVGNIYRNGNARTKAGDDYPIRIYVMFEYRPEQAGVLERMQYGLAKRLYGQYPPHSSLNYVWANKPDKARILGSPYTDRAKMVLLEQGASHVGIWQDEDVDILADYREAFGTDPPGRARIAVMNDSDNTGESSVSWLQYIEVYREKQQ